MPYAVAFALAAIVLPTDPIAVSAITERVPMPKRVMHMLEAESLLNDASGLVCFRFAVAEALTGGFSLAAATLAFLELAAVGLRGYELSGTRFSRSPVRRRYLTRGRGDSYAKWILSKSG